MDRLLASFEGPVESRGSFTLPAELRISRLRPLGFLTCVLGAGLRGGASWIRCTTRRGGRLRIQHDGCWDPADAELALGLQAAPSYRWRGQCLEVAVPAQGLEALLERYCWAPVDLSFEGRRLTRRPDMPECLVGRRWLAEPPERLRGKPAGLWNDERKASCWGLLGLGRRVHTAFRPRPSLVLLVDGLRVFRSVDFGFPDAGAVVAPVGLERTEDGLGVVEGWAYQELLAELRGQFREMAQDLAGLASSSAQASMAAPVLQALANFKGSWALNRTSPDNTVGGS